MVKILLLLTSVVVLTSCTQNQRAKTFGGTAEVHLPKGERLIDVTWKGEQIWYLTEKMPKGYTPKTYNFQEESSFGVIEGTVVFKENK